MESRSYLQHTICLSSSYRNYTTERFVVLNISSPSVSGTPSTFKWLFGLLKTFFNHWLQSCCFFKAGFMLSLESFSKHTHTLEGVCPPWSLSTRVNLKSSTLYFLNVSCFGTFTDSLFLQRWISPGFWSFCCCDHKDCPDAHPRTLTHTL